MAIDFSKLVADLATSAVDFNAADDITNSAQFSHAQNALMSSLTGMHDALRGLKDWVDEGCPDGGRYAIEEAEAALSGSSPPTRMCHGSETVRK